jgi:ATP-binding cassette subfamily B protein
LLSDAPEYRYLLAADDDLDDGAERDCDWAQDEDRTRLDHQYREQEVVNAREDDRERQAAERR